MRSYCNLMMLLEKASVHSGAFPLVLALMFALLPAHAAAGSSPDPVSVNNADSISDKAPKADNPAMVKTCPRCGEEKTDSARCQNCGFIFRTAPGRSIPYGLDGRTRYDLNSIGRSNQRIDRSMRSLQKSLRDMNTSINRIRVPSRRF
jgi:hypothetical protein